MTNEVLWECPHCGARHPERLAVLRHIRDAHHDTTSAPQEVGGPTSEYVNLTAPHLGGVQRARRVKTAQEDAAEINRTLPRLEAPRGGRRRHAQVRVRQCVLLQTR